MFVTFDAEASDSEFGQIVSYEWDFGDGNTKVETVATTTHTYTVAGPKSVTLKIVDEKGA